MDREQHDRMARVYWDIRNRAGGDPEYVRLYDITRELQERYESVMGQLSEPSRRTIELYITARENLNRRLLELACGEFSHLK